MNEQKKKCFVVTPIGSDNTEIRRHIDGIIDQAIIPALEDKYIVDVAHRKYEIGSINDRVISSIYESDLVIANLTNLNPNVMFELAMRYSYGKPAIVIAEKGTKLPFDIIDENTIFYINDPAGANELKNKINEFEANIDCSRQDYGPIYKAINKIPIYKAVESGESVSNDKMLTYIIERLDSIERNMRYNVRNRRRYRIIDLFFDMDEEDEDRIRKEITEKILSRSRIVENILFKESGMELFVLDSAPEDLVDREENRIAKILMEYGITTVECRRR